MHGQQCRKAKKPENGERVKDFFLKNEQNKPKKSKRTQQKASFSPLTHLKATLVGGIGGWLVRQRRRGGEGRTSSNVKKTGPIFSSQFALLYKVRCRKKIINKTKTKRTITFVGLLKARAAVVDRN